MMTGCRQHACAWLLAASIVMLALLLQVSLRVVSVAKSPIRVQKVVGFREQREVKMMKMMKMTYKLRPSSITAHLASQFHSCGQCVGESVQVGQVVICLEVLQKASHVVYYGASAWTDVGIGLASNLDRLKVKAPPSTLVDCFAPSALPGSVHFKKTCLTHEPHEKIGKFIPFRKANLIGVLNLESLEHIESQVLHEMDNANCFKDYQMLIIKFYALEMQSKHLLYMQVLEKLLTYFDLISTNTSACDSWGIPDHSFLMPTILWATFLRKDLVASASCNAQIPAQCTEGLDRPAFRANLASLPGERVGEPEEVFFETFSRNFINIEDPRYVNYVVPNNPKSMDLLRTFRLCHSCQSGALSRVGPKRDGGYLVCPESAAISRVAISIGIRGDDPFGTELSERFGLRVEGFDCTGKPFSCPKNFKRCNFTFHNKCIGKPFADMPPEQFMTLGEALHQYTQPNEEAVLKIDCEGCEWNVLPDIPLEVLRRFSMLVMEAHWLDQQHRHPQFQKTMEHLLDVFDLVHNHGCNCYGVWTINGTDFGMPRIVELTFVRKDQAKSMDCVNSKYQEGLDNKICGRWPDIVPEAFRLPSS